MIKAESSPIGQRGNGMVEIVVYVAVIAVAWFIIYCVFHYIYSTKENRLTHQAQAAEVQKKKKSSGIELTPRNPGGYQAECSGFLTKNCRR